MIIVYAGRHACKPYVIFMYTPHTHATHAATGKKIVPVETIVRYARGIIEGKTVLSRERGRGQRHGLNTKKKKNHSYADRYVLFVILPVIFSLLSRDRHRWSFDKQTSHRPCSASTYGRATFDLRFGPCRRSNVVRFSRTTTGRRKNTYS